jgi:hypothetical protein
MDELKAIRSFNLTKDNWTGLLALIKGLYDFMESLCESRGNLTLINVLGKIIFDPKPVVDENGKAIQGLQWATPRATFLSMLKLKNGFSKGACTMITVLRISN